MGRLMGLESEIDWTGVSDQDKADVLCRHVDFTKITPEQFAFTFGLSPTRSSTPRMTRWPAGSSTRAGARSQGRRLNASRGRFPS